MREFGELEKAIMDVMWSTDRAYVVREVRERLQYRRPVAYTTVMTVMNVLHHKGVLQRAKHGRAWRYWPVERREEHDARLMSEVLRSGGGGPLTMRRFFQRVGHEEISRFLGGATDEELRSLLQRVDDEEMARLRNAVLDVSSARLAVR